MCTGMDSTEESERMDVFSKEDFKAAATEGIKEESMSKLDNLLLGISKVAIVTGVAEILETYKPSAGRAGVRAMAKLILALPLTGNTNDEQFDVDLERVTREFLEEQKIEMADSTTQTPEEEAQSALAGN